MITYSTCLSACEKGGQWRRAVELLELMEERGVEPNGICLCAESCSTGVLNGVAEL